MDKKDKRSGWDVKDNDKRSGCDVKDNDAPMHPMFYVVKSVSIFLVSMFYFIVGSVFAVGFNKYFVVSRSASEMDKLSLMFIMLEMAVIFGEIAVMYYILRNIFTNFYRLGGGMQWPLEGWYGYKHSMLNEATTGGVVISFVLFFYQNKLIQRMNVFSKRIR